METDKTTLYDLAIFQHDEESSIFHKLNFTRTVGGRENLRHIFSSSLKDIPSIQNVQKTLQLILEKRDSWPLIISNGSVLMIHKFYETSIDEIPARPTSSSAFFYKVFHAPDYSLVKYSVGHAFDFIKGMQQIIKVFLTNDAPENLKRFLQKANVLIEKQQLSIVAAKEKMSDLSMHEMLELAHYIRYHFKQYLLDLIEIYYQLDAWYGMAMAVAEYKFCLLYTSDAADE